MRVKKMVNPYKTREINVTGYFHLIVKISSFSRNCAALQLHLKIPCGSVASSI